MNMTTRAPSYHPSSDRRADLGEQIFIPDGSSLLSVPDLGHYMAEDLVVIRGRGPIHGQRFLSSMTRVLALEAEGHSFVLTKCESGVFAYVAVSR